MFAKKKKEKEKQTENETEFEWRKNNERQHNGELKIWLTVDDDVRTILKWNFIK